MTKRTILSKISKTYDPIEWLAPIVVAFKIFMQKLSLKGVTWNEELLSSYEESGYSYKDVPLI